jgi:hypothetical protein
MEFDGVGVEVKVIAGGMVTVMIEERTRKVANGVGYGGIDADMITKWAWEISGTSPDFTLGIAVA